MENKLNKHYFEIYAALTLDLFGIPLDLIAFRDRPDLQCDELDIGIEVTQSIPYDQEKNPSLVNDYIKKGYTGELIQKELRRDRLLQGAAHEPDREFLRPHTDPLDLGAYFADLIEHIEIKIHKLNNGYRKFGQNGLYVFTDTGLMEPGELDGFFASNRHRFENGFDLYFINCIDRIFLQDFKAGVLIEQTVSEEALGRLHVKALGLAGQEPIEKKARNWKGRIKKTAGPESMD